MNIVRQRFMYWHIPSTTRVVLKRERNEGYCFYPLKRVKQVRSSVRYIRCLIYEPFAKTIWDRRVTLS
ncbi:hypothetical protein [Endozoicomonas sp. ALD040]|uniref:hypothetical protein n=1 Tax=unclassified Endozoicomonas TaxID=2644528 RepID=UPI003BB15405